MSTTASIEILTPVIDLSDDDDDDDDDIDQTDIECRYSVTRQSGLLFILCMLNRKKNTKNSIRNDMGFFQMHACSLSDFSACVDDIIH